MSWLYRLVAAAFLGLGALTAAVDLTRLPRAGGGSDSPGTLALFGLLFVAIGALNLLNERYGSHARALGPTCIAIDAVTALVMARLASLGHVAWGTAWAVPAGLLLLTVLAAAGQARVRRGAPAPGLPTAETLQAFADAWNRHDADALMSFMADDCVFEASAGPDVSGTRYVGREAVRAGFVEVWKVFPDAHWGHARHFVQGDRGVSEWTFTGTRADGARVEVHGCDLFTFHGGRIALKNSYRKNRPPLVAATG